MDLLPEIAQRVSIRQFTDELIDRKQVDNILEAGRLAPSAKNRQPWRFIAITEESIRKRIEKAAFGQEHVGKAPLIIAACTTNIDYRMPNGLLSFPIDVSFAASFMLLQAESENLGTCIVTTFDEQEVKEILTVPYKMRVVLLLLVGHPVEKPEQVARMASGRVVSFNHW
jgi:nitroreductase